MADERVYYPDPTSELTLEWVARQFHRISNVLKNPISGEFLVPSSLQVNAGGTPVGDETDMQVIYDGNEYNLPEAATTPGFDLDITFTDVSNIYGFVMHAYYSPSTSPHTVSVNLYNYGTTNYDQYILIPGADSADYRTVLIPDDSAYIDNGTAILNFNHAPAGNVAHDLYIDYVALLY